MSHNIEYYSYSVDIPCKRIEAGLQEYAEHATWQEGGGGLPQGIRWIDRTFNSYDEAQEYIKKQDNGWYDQLAVKYLEFPEGKKTQAIINMQERLQTLVQERKEFEASTHIKDTHKSQYIGCQKCGSKINREYIGYNDCCPVCRSSMKSPTTIKRLASYDDRMKALRDKIIEAKEIQAKKNKPKTMWLVKIEYHT